LEGMLESKLVEFIWPAAREVVVVKISKSTE
jgi:hypothetical protein